MMLFRRLPKKLLDRLGDEDRRRYFVIEAEAAVRNDPDAPIELLLGYLPKRMHANIHRVYSRVHLEMADEKAALGIPHDARCIPVCCSIAALKSGSWIWTTSIRHALSPDWPPGCVGTARVLWDAIEDVSRAADLYVKLQKGVVMEGETEDGAAYREAIFGLSDGGPGPATAEARRIAERTRRRAKLVLTKGVEALLAEMRQAAISVHPDRAGGSHDLFVRRWSRYEEARKRFGR